VRPITRAASAAGERFDQYQREQITTYLANPIRPPSQAGGAYEDEPEKLREQLDNLFAVERGSGAGDSGAADGGQALSGIVSPHIDLHRGGSVYARVYRHLADHCDADLFVIFGTAHNPMDELFCVTCKDFDTPLGVVQTDSQFVERLTGHLSSSVAGQLLDIARDELVHRLVRRCTLDFGNARLTRFQSCPKLLLRKLGRFALLANSNGKRNPGVEKLTLLVAHFEEISSITDLPAGSFDRFAFCGIHLSVLCIRLFFLGRLDGCVVFLQSSLVPVDDRFRYLARLLGVHLEDQYGVGIDTVHNPPVVLRVADTQCAAARAHIRQRLGLRHAESLVFLEQA
jgi:hypothetical protein